jgi:putative endonuclease
MPGYVYILLCSDGSYYVGHTNNLELRMWAHEQGEGGDYTSSRLPVKLVLSEELPTVHDAFLAERHRSRDGLARRRGRSSVVISRRSWSSLRIGRGFDDWKDVLRQAQDALKEASCWSTGTVTCRTGDTSAPHEASPSPRG